MSKKMVDQSVIESDLRSALASAGNRMAKHTAALDQSRASARSLAVLAYAHGFSQVEIAKILGVARSTVIAWVVGDS